MSETPHETPPAPPDQPARRKRHRWWKYAVCVLALLLLLPVVVRLWWGYSAERELEAVVSQIEARGEPLAWADLAPEPIPDDDNAVLLYAKAAEVPLIAEVETDDRGDPRTPEDEHLNRLQDMLGDLAASSNYRRRHAEEVREILELSRAAFRLCREGRDRKGANWQMDFSAPAIEYELPPLWAHRRLAEALWLAALVAHEAGDDAAAVGYLRDVLALGRCLHTMPTLLGHLVALNVQEHACEAIERIAPGLSVGRDRKGAKVANVRALMGELLDVRAARAGLVAAMMGERSMIYDTVERLRRGEISASGISGAGQENWGRRLGRRAGTGLFFGPLFTADEARMLRYMNKYVEAARQDSYPGAAAKLPVLKIPTSQIERFSMMLSMILLPSFGKSHVHHYRHVATRRMTAAALAIRLYQLDRGRRPTKLEELVPRYLAAVPVDPFTKDGQPIRSLLDADRPLLYSVYKNGEDDGGHFAVDSDGGIETRKSLDCVFFLDGDRPEPKVKGEDPDDTDEKNALPDTPDDPSGGKKRPS